MITKRFAHQITLSKLGDLVKVYCSCGDQSPKIDPEAVPAWVAEHHEKVGLAEKIPKRKPRAV